MNWTFLTDSGKEYDAICLSEHWLFPKETINFTFNNHKVPHTFQGQYIYTEVS